jgi:hypothetical protein
VILVSNKTASDWTGQFFAYQGHKKAWAGTWRVNGQDYTGRPSFNVALHGYGTAKIVLTGDESRDPETGYLFMWGLGTSSAYDVSIAYFYNYFRNGKLTTSMGSNEGASHNLYYFPVEYSRPGSAAPVNTGIAWAPEYSTTPSTFEIKATLYLPNPSGTGQPYTSKNLTYTGHRAQFVSEIFPELQGTDFRGFLKLEADSVFFLEVLRMDTVDGGILLTSTPADWREP